MNSLQKTQKKNSFWLDVSFYDCGRCGVVWSTLITSLWSKWNRAKHYRNGNRNQELVLVNGNWSRKNWQKRKTNSLSFDFVVRYCQKIFHWKKGYSPDKNALPESKSALSKLRIQHHNKPYKYIYLRVYCCFFMKRLQQKRQILAQELNFCPRNSHWAIEWRMDRGDGTIFLNWLKTRRMEWVATGIRNGCMTMEIS